MSFTCKSPRKRTFHCTFGTFIGYSVDASELTNSSKLPFWNTFKALANTMAAQGALARHLPPLLAPQGELFIIIIIFLKGFLGCHEHFFFARDESSTCFFMISGMLSELGRDQV